jgi:glycosyltransferase involved in cell wall biosynthesis
MGKPEDTVDFSIVVPVYNSEKTLSMLYDRVVAAMEGKRFELILVDDCGKDNSWEVAKSLAANDARVVAVQLMRNYGQANATMCGLQHASGEVVITIDDDLQNPPEEIPVLIDTLDAHPEIDVVMGAPKSKKHSLWRNFGSNVLNRISSRLFFGRKKNLQLTSFRIMRRKVVNHLLAWKTPNPSPGSILCSITPNIMNVAVRHDTREYGKGGYTFTKLLGLTVDKTLSFSAFPLRFLAVLGLLGIVFSISVGAFFLVRYLTGGITVQGWITQILLLVGLSSFNFFAFGIVGEYLLRILQSVHQKPQYLVKNVINQKK